MAEGRGGRLEEDVESKIVAQVKVDRKLDSVRT